MASSGSSQVLNQGSEVAIDEKKRKRKISNRESARRSRLRKEKLVNDLMSEMNNLKNQNSQLLTALTLTTQNYYSVETENNLLRAHKAELTNKLQLLYLCNNNMNYMNNMNSYMNNMNMSSLNGLLCEESEMNIFESFINPWNNFSCMNQPIMASADTVFQY